jgi:hypothetical protein
MGYGVLPNFFVCVVLSPVSWDRCVLSWFVLVLVLVVRRSPFGFGFKVFRSTSVQVLMDRFDSTVLVQRYLAFCRELLTP